MIDLKCPCGKEGKYSHIVNGEEVSSCNKYNVLSKRIYKEALTWRK